MADGPDADSRAAARAVLLRLLADGRFRSGQELAGVLGVSRAAVWKRVRELAHALELQVDAVRGRGYRLASSLELLDSDRIAATLADGTASRLAALELRGTVRSTNAELLGRRLDDGARGVVCLAEQQTAGRGRRGRSWASPFGANVYLSLLWRFDVPPAGLSGLSLAAGVAVADALTAGGVCGVALKWPNDVLWGGRKLAGILVELAGESEGPTHAVVGVGVNWRMPETTGRRIDQPWVDVAGAVAGALPSRNLLAARLIDHLVAAAAVFRDAGLAPFLSRWRALDGLAGRPVRVALGERSVDGVELGVAASGALRVATVDGEREFHAGEVSLRPLDGV
jgi:BirA family biotin operon repressor/biotin-[acetyl-CoA-carboxylase] ligase